MKNIHILPTDKPSRLVSVTQEVGKGQFKRLYYIRTNYNIYDGRPCVLPQDYNICITNDEEIKDGDYVQHTQMFNHIGFTGIAKVGKQQVNQEFEMTSLDGHHSYYSCKEPKVILTTDQDLINDGVQAIPDEFLEWFVKNPNCEEMKLSMIPKCFCGKSGYKYSCNSYAYSNISGDICSKEVLEIPYKIIIPKEEPKLVKQPCIQCDGTGETTFSGTYNSQRKCDLCNGKGYIDSKDISQMQSDLELIQSLQKPKQECDANVLTCLNEKCICKAEKIKTGYTASETELIGVQITLKDGSQQFIPKQETFEEAAERILDANEVADGDMILSNTFSKVVKSMVEIAIWQQERSYSEEEVLDWTQIVFELTNKGYSIDEIIEQFKKK
jgi:hypothetical protein